MTSRIAYMMSFIGFAAVACTYQLPTVDPSLKCGDGIEDPEEECDDGNREDDDGCDSNCTFTTCGNGIVTYGEECDDGNLSSEDTCTNSCTSAKCGDGFVQPPESCDDGNANDGDGCESICIPSGCGNGIIAPNEVCDDSNTTNGDDCNSTCTLFGKSTLFLGQPGVAGAADGNSNTAQLRGGHYMVLWGDTIYLANNSTVRAIDINNQTITTIAGIAGGVDYVDSAVGADARFRDLRGITTDGATIWVSDVGTHVIRAISTTFPHAVSTVAGVPDTVTPVSIVDGMANQARLISPRGLAYMNGVVYFVETTAGVLRSFHPGTGNLATLAGVANMLGTQDGKADAARFQSPRHITPINGSLLYIADTFGYGIRSYDVETTEVSTIAGTSTCGYTNGDALNSKLFAPRGMALAGNDLYFADCNAHTIRQIQLESKTISTLSGTPDPCTTDCSTCVPDFPGGYAEGKPLDAKWNFPYDIVYHAASRSLFVSDGDNHVIRRIQ